MAFGRAQLCRVAGVVISQSCRTVHFDRGQQSQGQGMSVTLGTPLGSVVVMKIGRDRLE